MAAAPDELPLVDVDHVLICQVLANLIDNATRYAPGDTPVTVSASGGSDGAVQVTVADEGPGVKAGERASIFQMFNRREAGGRGGLGLAIARAFVEAHGQRIWVEERSGPGARFVLPSRWHAGRRSRLFEPREWADRGTGARDRRRPGAVAGAARRAGGPWARGRPRDPGEEGLSKVALDTPDVVVLDLGLPDLDGLEVCHRIRQWSEVPVIVLSATGLENRKVAALDGGANDYVTKPFGMAELEARIRTALRNSNGDRVAKDGRVAVGPLELDLVHHEATLNGTAIELTAREFDLLAYLARHAGKVCTHQMILGHVWGGEYGSEAEYLRVYVYRLRRKLGDDGARLLRTSPGIGYSLSAE